FGNEAPNIQNGTIINDEFYNEDLLTIEQTEYDGERWKINHKGYVFDLGWYPEADPKGSYRLTLLRGDWNNIIVEIETKKCEQIKYFIEYLLDLIVQGIQETEIIKLIKSDLENIKSDPNEEGWLTKLAKTV
ncbi:MAG: hypothetical protein ACRDEA_23505, partial [Microcystaceae cyanobacterium]